MNDGETSNVDKELTENDTEFGTEIDGGRNKLTKHQRQMAWRRHKIFQLMVQGVTNTYELSHILQVSQSTCFRDVQWLKAQATKELRTHIQERLPWQYKVCSEGITSVLRHAWSLVLEDNTKANKIATLSLISSCYKDLLEISTNAGVVTEALQQVENMKHELLNTRASKVQSVNEK